MDVCLPACIRGNEYHSFDLVEEKKIMVKKYQHKGSIPDCCKDCFHCRKVSPNSDHMKCAKGRIMPRKKNQCNIQKLKIKRRFFQFLRDEDALNKFYDEWKNQGTIKRIPFPKSYISNAFVWRSTNDKHVFWRNIHRDWLNVLKKEYGVTP